MAVGSEGATIAENKCFSIISRTATLSAEAFSGEDVSCVALTIQYVSGLGQKKVLLNRQLPKDGFADPKGAPAVKSITLKVDSSQT
jgi:hypothetical protein